MLDQVFYKKIENAPLIIFRIFFGVLITAECWGAILTGWVRRTFVEPIFTFPFFGFEWTRFLLGPFMYFLFFGMGILGILISLGYFYRINITLFAFSWSLVYFMQKTNYNNHYYLLLLVCWFMVFMPAHRYLSLDAKRYPRSNSLYMHNWVRLLFIAQLLIVYTFAAIAKLYPDWYEGTYLHIRFGQSAQWFNKHSWSILGNLLENLRFAQILSWLGIAFDFLIMPLLLWRPTQRFAFIAALLFHGFNSLTLQIGIFPYFALALSIFCFSPEAVRRFFLPKKTTFESLPHSPSKKQKWVMLTLLVYLVWQLYLPLRHWFIPGDVLWTEEGHRLSWRMMLRSKKGNIRFLLIDKEHHTNININLTDFLSKEQIQAMSICPDMIWQFANYLQKRAQEQGQDIAIFARSRISVNGRPYALFLDPKIDLTKVKWHYFTHQDWIREPPPSLYRPQEVKPHLF